MRLLKHSRGSGGAARKNEVRLKGGKFLRESFAQFDISCRPANVDFAVAALHPPELPKPLPKRRDRGLPFLVALSGERQDTDPAHPFGLLRPRRQRPCRSRRRAAEQRDELAALQRRDHSITSSASASSRSGTVRPSALAAFKLITSSNLVDCITGRSAGFSPLRMRPV